MCIFSTFLPFFFRMWLHICVRVNVFVIFHFIYRFNSKRLIYQLFVYYGCENRLSSWIFFLFFSNDYFLLVFFSILLYIWFFFSVRYVSRRFCTEKWPFMERYFKIRVLATDLPDGLLLMWTWCFQDSYQCYRNSPRNESLAPRP